MHKSGVESNFWKINLYKGIANFWVFSPVLVPLYRASKLNVTEVFLLQSAFACTLLCLQVLSGYLSDIIGRKKALILSTFILPFGIMAYALSDHFLGFLLAEILLGCSLSLRLGIDSALIYDTLLQLEQGGHYKHREGKAQFYEKTGMALAAVLGGALGMWSLRIPFYVNLATSLFLFPLVLFLIEPIRKRIETGNHIKELWRTIRYCGSHVKIRSVILYSSLITTTFLIGHWSYYLYYEQLGLQVGFYGVLLALCSFAMGYGSNIAHILERKLGSELLLHLLLLASVIFVIIGFVPSILCVPLLFMNSFIWGVSIPILSDYMNQLVKKEVRGTVLSFGHMSGRGWFMILSPLFGACVDHFSLNTAYLVLGVFFFFSGLFCLHLFKKHRVYSC